jgi:hypothetical protein
VDTDWYSLIVGNEVRSEREMAHPAGATEYDPLERGSIGSTGNQRATIFDQSGRGAAR